MKTFDTVIIGAGIAGMYQLHRLRQLGMSVQVFEIGEDVGGTWYWNRYPGARFDSESYSYGYSFSQEILDEWEWSEHFTAQPENERYLNFVTDKLDLRRDIRFNCRVTAAHWQEDEQRWQVEVNGSEEVYARFLITAVGILSEPQLPGIPGIDSFQGDYWHTARWPKTPVDFSDKRVGIIGTGATGIQVIQEVAKTVGELSVFQLQPNWAAPLNNRPIEEHEQAEIRARYPEIFAACRSSFGAFLHNFDERSVFDVSSEERERIFEELYNGPGFGIWLGNFADILTDQKANDIMTEFMKRKIRERVDDPKTAEGLIPTDHGFGLRRVPMESGYYEAFNQDNVHLIDLRQTPIERITPKGIQTTEGEHELDLIIYATGFNTVTGAFSRIDIRGRNGVTLKERWADGPHTYLGMQVADFPNMLMLVGPHNGATFCNIPRCIEQNVEWVSECLAHMQSKQLTRIETNREAEITWTDHVYEVAQQTLFPTVGSWFNGANTPGKPQVFQVYAGGMPAYRQKCEEVAESGYTGFQLS